MWQTGYKTDKPGHSQVNNYISRLLGLRISRTQQHHSSTGITGLLKIYNLFFETCVTRGLEHHNGKHIFPVILIILHNSVGKCYVSGESYINVSEYACGNIRVDNTKMKEKRTDMCWKRHLCNTLQLGGSESQFPEPLTFRIDSTSLDPSLSLMTICF